MEQNIEKISKLLDNNIIKLLLLPIIGFIFGCIVTSFINHKKDVKKETREQIYQPLFTEILSNEQYFTKNLKQIDYRYQIKHKIWSEIRNGYKYVNCAFIFKILAKIYFRALWKFNIEYAKYRGSVLNNINGILSDYGTNNIVIADDVWNWDKSENMMLNAVCSYLLYNEFEKTFDVLAPNDFWKDNINFSGNLSHNKLLEKKNEFIDELKSSTVNNNMVKFKFFIVKLAFKLFKRDVAKRCKI